ncbi:unnamed protein product [Polarella glacialis]|uniref:Uncharacterized protein n=1 Tax=Polarella glacialis TaxID=89957 RepID=A0A813DKI4_POLGL|nr:unnamed protein product [Polarella glacialis]
MLGCPVRAMAEHRSLPSALLSLVLAGLAVTLFGCNTTNLTCNGTNISGLLSAPVPLSLPMPLQLEAPNPPPGIAQPRLIVVNGCPSTVIWMASSETVPGDRNVRILPGERHMYFIPNAGLSSTRFWPKAWCNELGEKCTLGSSGGPGQDCPEHGCAPPVDSKFEASFGAEGVDCARDNRGCDWWDTSAVDGYTLPYKLVVNKTTCPRAKDLDCMGLSTNMCPVAENLGQAGWQNLKVTDPHTGKVVGCYSPCGKLAFSNWGNVAGRNAPQSEIAKPYCCPTPPVSSEECRTGPVIHTEFVSLIHQKCSNVYAYAYDDAVGLQVCQAGTTYEWTLGCPEGPAPPASVVV